MSLYTILSHEEIFGEDEEPRILEVARGEMRLLVTPSERGQAQIVRVISSNPVDYLNPAYQPGTFIELTGSDWEGWTGKGEQEG